jgi:hypothetical protein
MSTHLLIAAIFHPIETHILGIGEIPRLFHGDYPEAGGR